MSFTLHSISVWAHSGWVWLLSIWRTGVSKELAATLALAVLAAGLARFQASRVLAQEAMSFDERRRAIVSFRNGLALACLAILGLIWAGEIRGILLSVTALATAMILVSKEIISNFLGGMVFTFSKLAKIGDLIEINGTRGELVDHRWLYLTLMETGDSRYYTGNLVRVPNSALLTGSLRNYSLSASFRFETLVFHARPEHAAECRKIALAAAVTACEPWMAEAQLQIHSAADSHLFEAPDATPIASVVSKSHDCVEIHTRFPSPRERRASARQRVSELYYESAALFLERQELRKASLNAEAARSLSPLAPPLAAIEPGQSASAL